VHTNSSRTQGVAARRVGNQKLVPRCEIKTLHGAGHTCQLEQPWLFDQYMIEFLKKHGLFPVK
jgi:pimeloyl-ACP methyl ester carboxylesterase